MTESFVNGLFLLGAAVLALMGVLATRGEPRSAKELQALNAIIKDFPEGDADQRSKSVEACWRGGSRGAARSHRPI